jgi:hypothetical protein
MAKHPDSAISEIISAFLIVGLVVMLAAIVMVLIFGVTLLPAKPVFATFSADVVMGINASVPHTLNTPVILLYQTGGETLTQNYTKGTHSGINGTMVKLIDPNGKMYTVVQSVTMTAKEIQKGQQYYIFHYRVGEPNEYWITMDPARVYDAGWGGVEPFTPRGKWQLVITEEKNTNTVLFRKDLIIS